MESSHSGMQINVIKSYFAFTQKTLNVESGGDNFFLSQAVLFYTDS